MAQQSEEYFVTSLFYDYLIKKDAAFAGIYQKKFSAVSSVSVSLESFAGN